MRFVDEISFAIASGNGGDGHVSFRREKYVPRGGPNGGNGGRGGSVVFEATRQRNTLVDYRFNKTYRAQNGERGGSQQSTGKSGDDLVLWVPVGTLIRDDETREVLADLDTEGARFEVPGGRGGAGNAAFKTSTRQTPTFAKLGQPGAQMRVHLELKLLADVGLLGFPNAGKSTLISRISAARPRIADHPFTTLVPNLGVVSIDVGESFVVADIPGLIEGAAEGRGLGHQFLRHVERCGVLLHLVPPDAPEGDPATLYRTLREELAAYDETLPERPELVALTKVDLLDDATRDRLLGELAAAAGGEVMAISSATGHGLRALVGKLAVALAAAREDAPVDGSAESVSDDPGW
jgi:GTP-binding protein